MGTMEKKRPVSKTSESLREAPATVVVVTGEEIERRGYLHLADIFQDLPGFDVSRGNGVVYSSLYQRGFRATGSDRLLFLVDGVQQNDAAVNALEARALGDYMFHRVMERASDEDIPVQIHTGYLAGTWGSLAGTPARLLIPVFEKFRRVRFPKA